MATRSGWLLLLVLSPAVVGQETLFEPAESCRLCHSRIQSGGQMVAPYALWPGSMMANAARDPYWLAKVRYEIATTPAAAVAIEDKCLRCHAPANQYVTRAKGGMRLAQLPEGGGEGVTCTVCHQIKADGLGKAASFTGGFEINADHKIYGPHADPFEMPMLHHTGYTPAEGKHILESSLCGSCHTVITPTLDAQGVKQGDFIEQAPYLEWLASDFPRAGVTCQSCHVPPIKDAAGKLTPTFIAHMPPGRPFPPTEPRTPFGLHFFAGANGAMLSLLGRLEPERMPQLERTAQRAREMLRSALLVEPSATRKEGRLQLDVDVRNLTGHKVPTAFPSRRVWLHVLVTAADGSKVFESGEWDAKTSEIAGGEQPHYAVISKPSQAMIYEATYRDSEGKSTMSLLRAASYGKDNRILPRGFDATRVLPGGWKADRIAAAGVSDAGFQPGVHRVRYDIANSQGANRVVVEACYQSIAPRHVASLGDAKHIDIERFRRLYGPGQTPEVIARVEVDLSREAAQSNPD
ncbi:MAG: hypothetical protein JNN08_12130 [Bryobacterales bacterium]|nr:hypothetical protein [Bryobacterales bacterium]